MDAYQEMEGEEVDIYQEMEGEKSGYRPGNRGGRKVDYANLIRVTHKIGDVGLH